MPEELSFQVVEGVREAAKGVRRVEFARLRAE